MTMSIRSALTGAALLLLLGMWSIPAVAQEAEAATFNCVDCHEDQAKAFTGNPHARGQLEGGQVPTAVCETCHGDGKAHMEAGGDTSLIQVPRGFQGSENTCLMCHDKVTDKRTHRFGAHANSAAVNCLTCHSIHTKAGQLVAKQQPDLCASCHAAKAASFRTKPYTHRMGRAGLACTTCHDPHAPAGRENIRRTPAGEVACLSCHSDKRGPFVFQHGALAAGECTSCHEPHGSSNPNQLKRANVWQLCIECHSPLTHETLGSQPPSFHNLTQARYQSCTTCHVAIHGSNRSPALLK